MSFHPWIEHTLLFSALDWTRNYSTDSFHGDGIYSLNFPWIFQRRPANCQSMDDNFWLPLLSHLSFYRKRKCVTFWRNREGWRAEGSGPHCSKVGLLKRRIKILVFAFASTQDCCLPEIMHRGANRWRMSRGSRGGVGWARELVSCLTGAADN